MTTKRIAVIGAGGFAREVRWLIDEINRVTPTYSFLGYLVSDMAKLGDHDSKDQVLGDFSWLDNSKIKLDCLALGIGNPISKLTVIESLRQINHTVECPPLVHPSVKFDRDTCKLEEGVVLCAGTIGTVGITFGAFAMVNLQCTIGHEAVIGRACVLNPSVNISGGVQLGEGVLVGTGAQILQYLKVGDRAIVGSGAVVTRVVEPGETVIGIPAKPLARKN